MGFGCCRRKGSAAVGVTEASGGQTQTVAAAPSGPAQVVPAEGILLSSVSDIEAQAGGAVQCEVVVVSGDTAPEVPKEPLRKTAVGQPQAAGGEYRTQHHQAAVQMQKCFRGARDRNQATDRFYAESSRGSKAVDPRVIGLGPYAEMHSKMPKVPDSARYAVRDATIKAIWPQLGCPLEALPGRGYYSTFEESARFFLERLTKDKSSLPEAARRQLAMARLFVDSAELAKEEIPKSTSRSTMSSSSGFVERRKDCYLLGQFDSLAVPVRADFDAWFRVVKRGSPKAAAAKPAKAGVGGAASDSMDCDGPSGWTGWFWIFHAAAPNIGESAQAEDFVAYSHEEEVRTQDATDSRGAEMDVSKQRSLGTNSNTSRCCWKQNQLSRPIRRLDEDRYVRDMGKLWRNALLAMGRLGIEDAIFFPFGMGAFLRHLGQNDDRYVSQDAMLALRRRVADELMDAIAELCVPAQGSPRLGPPCVHLCLVCIGEESIDNHNAFLEAAAAKVKQCRLMEVLQLRQNVDCLQLANELAEKGAATKAPKVAILNGCNRKLIGNHWFQGGARMAIDENLHRRSASMARCALLLNYDFEPRPRRPGALRDTVAWLGGQVVRLTDGSLLGGTSKAGMPPSTPNVKGSGPSATGAGAAGAPGNGAPDGPPARRGRCCGCGGSRTKKAKTEASNDTNTAATSTPKSSGGSPKSSGASPKAQNQTTKKPAVKQGWQ